MTRARCEYFALCEREADGVVEHRILGEVPCCERCADRVGADLIRYRAQAARDAQARGYGGRAYWDYLERACHESHDHWLHRGDAGRAEEMLTRSLSEALAGNDGD